MRVSIDQDRCVGSGQCVMAAPAVFDQRDEDGIVTLLDENPSDDEYAAVEQAAAVCPALAITVTK